MPKRQRRASSPPHDAPTIFSTTDLDGIAALMRGRVFLVTDQSGDLVPNSRGMGLYLGDTRMLSCLVLSVEGQQPVVLRPDPDGPAHGRIVLSDPGFGPDPGRKPLRARSLVQ